MLEVQDGNTSAWAAAELLDSGKTIVVICGDCAVWHCNYDIMYYYVPF